MTRAVALGAALGGFCWLLLHAGALLLVPASDRPLADVTARLGVLMIVGPVLLAPWLGRRGARAWTQEGAALLVAGALTFLVTAGAGSLTGVLLVVGLWAVPWGLALVLRTGRLAGAVPLVYLGLVALALGTPYLGRPGYGPVPDWMLAWNPLVRLHWEVEGRDWLKSPLLYDLVGEGNYRYAKGYGAQLVAAGAAVAGVVLALALGRRSRARGGLGV